MKRKTVVITGASSGIGREFAAAYAKKGYRLVLTGRRVDRLMALARELKVPCRVLPADLSDEDQCLWLCKKLEREQVDVFINNAGFGICGDFTENSLSREVSMLHVNVRAMHILFKKMLQKMQAQGYGTVLNVASSAGLLPAGPHMAAYYASKSYVVSLSRAVARELKEAGSPIYVAALCPGPVDTEFNERADVEFALKGITPAECVRQAIRGMEKKKTVIVPTAKLRLAIEAQHILPEQLLLSVISMQQKRKRSGK